MSRRRNAADHSGCVDVPIKNQSIEHTQICAEMFFGVEIGKEEWFLCFCCHLQVSVARVHTKTSLFSSRHLPFRPSCACTKKQKTKITNGAKLLASLQGSDLHLPAGTKGNHKRTKQRDKCLKSLATVACGTRLKILHQPDRPAALTKSILCPLIGPSRGVMKFFRSKKSFS